MSLLDLALQQRWAITEDALRGIFALVNRESLDPDLARQIREDRETRPSALAAQAGRPLDGARSARVRDGVAIIEVNGPIVRRADMFSDISGATSVEWLARDFAAAQRDTLVDAIMLAIDSPGGEITGINEFARMIFDARGNKPVWAYVGGLGASAGYWIASAAEQIIIDDTAALGSIGVVMAVPDPAKRTSKEIEIVSSQSPNKRPDVTTERGRQLIQTIVDDSAAVFIDAVARQRKASTETVVRDFGQGGVMVGKVAVVAGLADRLGSFEATLADIRQAAIKRKMRPRMGATEEPMDKGFWANMFGGMFSAAKAEGIAVDGETIEPRTPALGEVLTSANVPAGSPITSSHTVMSTQAASTPDPREERIAALEKQLAEQQTAQIQAAAAAFADGAIRQSLALPSEREKLIALHVQAAQDDTRDSGTRRANLEQLISSRPPHSLSSEQVKVGEGGVLESQSSTGGLSPERRQKLLSMTPLGQAARKTTPAA